MSNRYSTLIEKIFFAHYKKGAQEVAFERRELEAHARRLKMTVPKNLGDIIYSFRYRVPLPQSIRKLAPPGSEWIIRSTGASAYKLVIVRRIAIAPNPALSETKILDATPGIVARYAMSDEQALLAKVRYNRLIDIFTGVTCYSLQGHLRTTVPELGQIETDEIYVGVDAKGAHYVFPIQAKGGKDKLGIVQIEQDIRLCAHRFKNLICTPIAAQFISDDLIALFAFEEVEDELKVSSERHYRLVARDQLTEEELAAYRARLE